MNVAPSGLFFFAHDPRGVAPGYHISALRAFHVIYGSAWLNQISHSPPDSVDRWPGGLLDARVGPEVEAGDVVVHSQVEFAVDDHR